MARAVGATNAVAFDLTAACSGFLFGVNTASQFLHNGAYGTVRPRRSPRSPAARRRVDASPG